MKYEEHTVAAFDTLREKNAVKVILNRIYLILVKQEDDNEENYFIKME